MTREEQYRTPGYALAMVKAMPELCGHLAALTLPSAAPRDGQPVAAEVRRLPLRGAPLDDLDAVFRELHNSVSYWSEKLERPEWERFDYMVRRTADGEVTGPAIVVTEPNGIDTITVWAQTLANRLETWWVDILDHQAFESWVENVHDWFGKPAVRWPLESRQPTRQRPRECANCRARDVLADPLVPGQALCQSCSRVYQPQEWVTLSELGRRIGRSKSTIEAWIAGGDLEVRRLSALRDLDVPGQAPRAGNVRHAELGAAKRLAKRKEGQRAATAF